MASQEGRQEVVQLLLKRRGEYVEAPDADRETALHLAAYYGHLQVTRLLLDYGADVHALNNNGKAPFKLASKEGYHEDAQLLLEPGATRRNTPENLSSHEQSVPMAQDTGTPIDLSPSSGTPLDPGPAYPVQGVRSQREDSLQRVDDLSRTDDDAYPGGFEKPSNITSPSVDNRPMSHTSSLSSYALQGFTPSIVQDEYDDLRYIRPLSTWR
jgi:ankyrin repeat protein